MLAAAAVVGGGLLAVYVPRKVAALEPKDDEDEQPILFYDGVCHLCQAFVSFVLNHEHRGRVKFATIQENGDLMRELGAGAYAEGGEHHLRSIVLVQHAKVYVRSDAALRVIAMFDAPYKYLAVLHGMPVNLRDAGYKLVARWRYRIFGEATDIINPPPEHKARFITKK